MLPRSEKFYVVVVVVVALAVITASIVGAVRAFTGHTAATPAYESAPPSQLLHQPDTTIVDLGDIDRPPITDADFLVLHRSTREIVPELLSEGDAALKPLADNQTVLATLTSGLPQLRTAVSGFTSTKAGTVDVARPELETISGGTQAIRTRTTQTIEYDQIGTAPSSVVWTLYWVQRPAGWRIFDIQGQFVGNGTQAAQPLTGDGTGLGDTTSESPQDPNAVTGGDATGSDSSGN